jgi:sn-glycerol 3-phosphate transport system ATP-binding protein
MAAIDLENVSKYFDRGAALDGLSLKIADREVLTVVGPSGCGKSTLLRLIAGLDSPTSGTIRMDGVRVEGTAPRERNVAMVFQSYALYPHMSCYDNLALNLRLKRCAPSEIDRRVRETAAMLDIADLLDKKPRQLSGGQRQRVAVGRALIRKPQAFLLDEPLSNLDALLRERVRHELRELFRKVEATVIYVTHDQIEAMTLADRVAVLDRGRLQQVGTPEELYGRPANRFVASFIGSPSMNFFEAELDDGSFLLGGIRYETGLRLSRRVTIGIRPEALHGSGQNAAGFPARVCWTESLGAQFLIGMKVGEITLTALAAGKPAGEFLHVAFDPKQIHVFDDHTGENLRLDPCHRTAGRQF